MFDLKSFILVTSLTLIPPWYFDILTLHLSFGKGQVEISPYFIYNERIVVSYLRSLGHSFFLRKNLERTKTQIKPKPTNKTKTSEQKTIKATIFRAEKLLRWGKMFVLSFLKKLNCPNNLIHNTTDVYPYQLTYWEFICNLFIRSMWPTVQTSNNYPTN